MQYQEPPTKIYEPRASDHARTAVPDDSSAPVRIYPPAEAQEEKA